MAELKLVVPSLAAQEYRSASVFDAFIAYCRRDPKKYFNFQELEVLKILLQLRSRHWSTEQFAHIVERLSSLRELTQEEQEEEIEAELVHVSSKVWLQNPLNQFVLGCKRMYGVKKLPFMPERERYLRAAFIIFLTTS